jgi:hypothetical protein
MQGHEPNNCKRITVLTSHTSVSVVARLYTSRAKAKGDEAIMYQMKPWNIKLNAVARQTRGLIRTLISKLVSIVEIIDWMSTV